MDHPETSNRPRNPWFSDCWYLSTYSDVRHSGLPPAQHYEEYGWREGRDPSGLFSTGWYLDQNADVAASGLNPLAHYVSHGRAEGRMPHPGLNPVDHGNSRVAVIVVSFNAAIVVEVLLASLVRARNDTPFTLFLVENGSRPEVKEAVGQLARDYADRLDIRYIDSAENLGFSGGNNLAIVEALKEDYSHLCLLNSDVVCTTGWIDLLLATGAPVVSPVSNAVGNEQTVPIDYTCMPTMEALDAAEHFARRRAEAFEQSLCRTDFLGFFCVMLERSVVERIGLLDERFHPGSYEDDDYCLRIANAGYEMLIARHVYLHHFGSSSFSMLAWEQRVAVGNENRARFEAKWQRPWVDRSHLPALSLVQDAASYRARGNGDALLREMVRSGVDHLSRQIAGLTDALAHARSEVEARDRRLLQLAEPGPDAETPPATGPAIWIKWGDAPASLAALPADARAAYGTFLRLAWQELIRREFLSLDTLTGLQPFLRQLATLFRDAPPVLILTQADPVTSDEKDGYVQRVRAVDRLLDDRRRIYIRIEDRFRSQPVLAELAPDIWQLDVADHDPLGDALLAGLFGSGANLYAHSLFGLQARTVRRLAKTRAGTLILDLHGSVPEEYAMYGDGFGAQVYGGYEVEAAASIDHLVAVSANMARHFAAKHAFPADRTTVCPIFVEAGERARERPYFTRPRVIYAGGTQKWQQVPKMARLVMEDAGRSDFLFLTPAPAAFMQQCRDAGLTHDGNSFTVRAAAHAEVLATYGKFDFGILLRERSVVNRVACPTKLIEYLTFGVVPILDTTAVGDFVDLGMQFVSLDDYAAGRIPDVDRRRAIAINNWTVLDRLKEQMERGSTWIRDRMLDDTSKNRAAA